MALHDCIQARNQAFAKGGGGRTGTNSQKFFFENYLIQTAVLSKLLLLKCITNGFLEAEPPAVGDHGGLGQIPSSAAIFVIFRKKNYLF